MLSFTSTPGFLAAVLLATSASSFPTSNERRYVDLDHNGIPDFCVDAENGGVSCELPDGTWTTIATTTSASTPSPTPSSVSASGTGSSSDLVTGTLPSASDFAAQNGTSWNLEYVGNLNYSGVLGTESLYGDKARSSVVGGKTIWNFGDMMCPPDYTKCGFSMGPALFDDERGFTLNTQNINNINDALFASNYSTDGIPEDSGCSAW